jgi:hypothetical protein
MPLKKGSSNAVVSSNIQELMKSDHPQKQAIAIALSESRRKRATGGKLKAMAPPIPSPGTVIQPHVGPIHSAVAGRTDHLPMHVPSGAYVIPADIISAMGEGNTMAGFKIMNDIVKQYGGIQPRMADGGAAGQKVAIVAAGGEYVIPPEVVVSMGNGSMDSGHTELDQFVRKMRAKTVKTLRSLPGPKKN